MHGTDRHELFDIDLAGRGVDWLADFGEELLMDAARDDQDEHAGGRGLVNIGSPHLTQRDQLALLDSFDHDRRNILAAITALMARDDIGDAIEVTWGQWPYWWVRGLHREARRLMEAALARGGLSRQWAARAGASPDWQHGLVRG